MVNELKLFSDAISGKTNKMLRNAIIHSSRSQKDAEQRIKTYEKVFSNYAELKRLSKTFSSYQESDLLSNQYFNATVTALATSFAGFLSIERAMDQPKALLYWLDLIGVSNNAKVLPNVGPENIGSYRNKTQWNTALTVGTTAYSAIIGKKLLPGTIKIEATHAATGQVVVITDDRQGNLVAAPGVLTNGSANYATGLVTFDLGSGFVIAAGDTVNLTAIEDQSGTPNINRFKTDLQSIAADSYPEILVGETNLTSLAAMQKSLGINAEDVIVAKLTELYTKIINRAIVGEIVNNYVGNTYTIDVDQTPFYDYTSRIDKFTAELTDVNQELAIKSVKGVKATAYLCGTDVAAYFMKTRKDGLFKDAPSSYVNDLVGYFGDIPILQHVDIPSDEAYAIHKTIDGNLAPVVRGSFLPLTNTPTIGNYENPTQLATGVYYQEVTKSIVPELVQKFKLINI